MPTFHTTLLLNGNNVGIEVPPEVVAELGSGKRPKVVVTVNGYTYRSTVAVMGGLNLIPLNAAHRGAAGVAGGEEHDITLELDEAPRTVEVPPDVATALAEAGLREAFDGLSFTQRKEHVRAISDAKKPETRQRRLEKLLTTLGG